MLFRVGNFFMMISYRFHRLNTILNIFPSGGYNGGVATTETNQKENTMNGKWKKTGRLLTALLAALVLGSVPATGRIKLAALPERDRVDIMLDNGRFTLVEEERVVPLLKSTKERGNNRIDFSWSNTRIDKNSIQFRPVAIRRGGDFVPVRKVTLPGGVEIGEVQVTSVSYPPGENALVWDVYAAESCAVKVRVSYLISNLDRTFSYKALTDRQETWMSLRKFVRVSNYSGEDFGTAGIWAGFGDIFRKVVGQDETLEILIHKYDRVPIEKTYTFDWYKHGALNNEKPYASRIQMHYVLHNDKAHGMGLFPLEAGKARIFIQDGSGSSAFLGEDWAGLTPIDDKLRLFLGDAQDVVCTRKIKANQRHEVRGNLFNQEITITYELENFKDKPVNLRIVEQLQRLVADYGRAQSGIEWSSQSGTSPEITISLEEGGDNPVLQVKLPARPADKSAPVVKTVLTFHILVKNLW